MSLTTTKWTVEDYHQMINAGILEGRHVELINGEIVEMSPEGSPHANKSTRAGEYLIRLLSNQAQVRSSKPITLSDNSEPEPDLAIVQRLEEEYDRHHPYPENIFWLIEYSNTSLAKDLETKTQVYARARITEYWVVNLKENKLIVFRDPINDQYQFQQELTDGNVTPLSFSNVAISVSKILG
ncbi:MAG: Uma2 family endonuclease [Oculatellaceae cyanobacterium bins.114]|nr:Uma2 family endonuclease [Oculatellaceae cyanobacterium bins.114]